jgi:uracil-DNA glycosylase
MNFDNFKSLIHESWWRKLKPFIESKDCDKIYQLLKSESGRGKLLAPLSSNTWRAFKETPYDDLKVVLIGLSPYHTFKDGLPVSDGLLMGCSITGKLQPSLEKWYDAIEKELYDGLNLHFTRDPDLSFLAHQGVLLLNASLTCEKDKAGSHCDIWAPFMKYLLEEVLDVTGVPIVFLGREAAKYSKHVGPFTWKFEISHPASAAYKSVDWDSEGLFLKLNKILKDSNNTSIEWIKTE